MKPLLTEFDLMQMALGRTKDSIQLKQNSSQLMRLRLIQSVFTNSSQVLLSSEDFSYILQDHSDIIDFILNFIDYFEKLDKENSEFIFESDSYRELREFLNKSTLNYMQSRGKIFGPKLGNLD